MREQQTSKETLVKCGPKEVSFELALESRSCLRVTQVVRECVPLCGARVGESALTKSLCSCGWDD